MDRERFSTEKRSYGTNYQSIVSAKRNRYSNDIKLEPVPPDDESECGDLNGYVLELILARLPISDLFRFRSVCKGWYSLIRSPSFLTACSEVRSRTPWFYMLEAKSDGGVIYDIEVGRWCHTHPLSTLTGPGKSRPVAASGSLVCFQLRNGNLSVCNPLSGSCRELPPMNSEFSINSVAMHSYKSSYRIVVILNDSLTFRAKMYTSSGKQWVDLPVYGWIRDATKIFEKQTSASPRDSASLHDDSAVFNPMLGEAQCKMKEFSSVGGEVIHFLNGGDRVIAFDSKEGRMYNLPDILPPEFIYSIDIVEFKGGVLLVVLIEMMETATLRIWEFRPSEMEWVQVLAMPPAMSHRYYRKKATIKCVGCGDYIMVCVRSRRFHQVVLCNVVENSWMELPRCYVPGSRKIKRFTSCFSFEPRIEACV